MSLAAVDTLRPEWQRASGSVLLHHGACCEQARAWLLGMARAHDFTATDGLQCTGPTWLTRRYEWGPTRWPIAWCEAVRSRRIDCGVFAAFARCIFQAKGLDAHLGQVLRAYSPHSTAHWSQKWSATPGAFNWIGREVVFHEVCVLRSGAGNARVYDPTDGQWLEATVAGGHGGHKAIRAEIPVGLQWGPHRLTPGQWTVLEATS